MTQNPAAELLESEAAKTMLEAGQERGWIEPAELDEFVLEHELADSDLVPLMGELERIGLEVRVAGPDGLSFTKTDQFVDEDDQLLGMRDSLKLFMVELGRHKLATATGLQIHEVDEAPTAPFVAFSLNQTAGADDGNEFGDLYPDPEAADPFEQTEQSLRNDGIRKALATLPPREQRILELRYGLDSEPETLEQIGRELGFTRERIRQLEREALLRLGKLRELSALTT